MKLRSWCALTATALALVLLGCSNTRFLGIERLWQSDEQRKEQAKNDEGEKALALVKERAEVKAWLSLFTGPDDTSPKTGGKACFSLEQQGPNKWLVHTYEDMPDHVATHNWYHVDLEKKEVTPEF